MPQAEFDVRHFAHLARLNIRAEDIAPMQDQMNDILQLISRIGDLELDEVPPTDHAVELLNVLREDVSRPSEPLERVLSRFPQVEDGMNRVPQMVGGDE